VVVHDVSGRRVARLADGDFSPGVHRLTWDGRMSTGESVAPGMYFVSMETDAKRMRRSVLITR
jgi:flagellar hook assembly protein FlgD